MKKTENNYVNVNLSITENTKSINRNTDRNIDRSIDRSIGGKENNFFENASKTYERKDGV